MLSLVVLCAIAPVLCIKDVLWWDGALYSTVHEVFLHYIVIVHFSERP